MTSYSTPSPSLSSSTQNPHRRCKASSSASALAFSAASVPLSRASSSFTPSTSTTTCPSSFDSVSPSRHRFLPSIRIIHPALAPAPPPPSPQSLPVQPRMCDESPPSDSPSVELYVPLLTSVRPEEMPMPGETCRLLVPFSMLKRLQENYNRELCLLPKVWDGGSSANKIGVLVTVLKVIKVIKSTSGDAAEDDHLVLTECRCPCRALITERRDETKNISPTVQISKIHDMPLTALEERKKVADGEWNVWLSILEVARLKRKLTPLYKENDHETRVRASAPKHYDRAVTEDEWKLTPDTTKTAYSRRAESFSFAVIRAIGGSGSGNGKEIESEEMSSYVQQAFELKETAGRLQLAERCIEEEMAKIRVQLSIKDIIG